MPSFGLPSSSMPPGSSSLSPCISTLLSSNLSSGPETSPCAAAPDGCMSHLFGTPHLPPPPPLSLSEASPYSPPPAYPPVFPLGPPLLASARFPPPPNPSFARPASNITFFEGPQSHYPPDNTAYDRWSDRCISSIPYYGGGDHTKSFAHWPLPTYNNSSNNNSNAGFLKPEPIFQPFAPYPPVDSVTNFGPKFSPFSGFPNAAAAGMPSTPSASITSPLASGHFTAFPPPNLPLDFPHSSGGGGRFPFNSHGSTFLPGMDPPPSFGPGNSEFMPEPFPSYLSRPGAVYHPSSSFQASDPFHDDSPRPIPSPAEPTSRPVVSDSIPGSDAAFLSRIYYPPPETFHGSSNVLSHTFSPRSDSNAPGPLCSSEGAPGLELSSDFLASFSLPYPPPHPGNLFTPYSCSAPLYQDSSSRNSGRSSSSPNKREDEGRDRIVGETGKLLYQHLSPEEWRWKHYEPSFADAKLPSLYELARVRPPGFNHFNGVDSTVYPTVPNYSNGFVVKEEGCSSGAVKSQREQFDMLDRSKAHNQSGPSLKLAASALAEMLASGNQTSRPESGRMQTVSSHPVGFQPSDDPTSVIGPTASNAWSGLSLFGPHQEVPSMTSSQLPSDPSHNDRWQVKSTSCGSSPPLSQAHLDQQRAMSGPSVGAASRVLANRKWSCPESSSQTEVAYLGTGFHALTASISNLSKVLFSLDSSALTPPDSAVLEGTLQSSILRLSECLLLEQARINRNPATRFVGSDESSTSRQGRADGPLADIDFRRHSETGGSSNLTHLKASDYGVVPNAGRSGSPSQLCNLNDVRATSTISALETVDPGGSVINSHIVQSPLPLNNESYSVSQCSVNDVGFRAGKNTHRSYANSKRSSSFQQKAAVGDDVIKLLRDNYILERSSLERLIGAEEREAKLKVLLDELREELEQERVENRGTVILCEKIMQEAEVSRGKAVMQEQNADWKSEKRNIECNVQGGSSSIHNSTLDKSFDSEVSMCNGEFDLTRHEKEGQIELGEEADSTAMKHLENPLLNKVYREVESRLALLRARPLISNGSSESELEEDIDALALRNRSEDAVLNSSCEGASQRTLLARSAATAPVTISNDTSGSVESRLALLQARETSLHELSSHEANYDIEEVTTYPWEKQLARHDAALDGVEGRLALLNGRSDWDNELGVFTETEPCTPAIPAANDLDSSTGSFSGLSMTAKALKTITSQLNLHSKTISNMHTAWSQLSEKVNSKSSEKESNTELRQKEADGDISNAARQGYGGTEAVEAQAPLIRSKPEWTERDVSESETEECLGEQVCNVSSTNSACARYESDQFETMNEISTVRLLDSDIELSQALQVKNTTVCPSLQKENGDTRRVEFSKLENGNPATGQDSEDDSGWEHVPYLQFPQNEAE